MLSNFPTKNKPQMTGNRHPKLQQCRGTRNRAADGKIEGNPGGKGDRKYGDFFHKATKKYESAHKNAVKNWEGAKKCAESTIEM